MKKLDPNAKILFYISGFFVSFFVIVFPVSIFALSFIAGGAIGEDLGIGILGFLFFLFGIFITFLFPLPWAYLAYENYKYELQKDRVYIEKGIIWKKYVSIPFDRVQNVDIVRGPIARLLGLSDLQIQTAGAVHVIIEGRIPGIKPEEANKLKDEILSKISKKNQGL